MYLGLGNYARVFHQMFMYLGAATSAYWFSCIMVYTRAYNSASSPFTLVSRLLMKAKDLPGITHTETLTHGFCDSFMDLVSQITKHSSYQVCSSWSFLVTKVL